MGINLEKDRQGATETLTAKCMSEKSHKEKTYNIE
jgi:hypothetical protein